MSILVQMERISIKKWVKRPGEQGSGGRNYVKQFVARWLFILMIIREDE